MTAGVFLRRLEHWPLRPETAAAAGGLRRSRTKVNVVLRLAGRVKEGAPGGWVPPGRADRISAPLFCVGDAVLMGWLERHPGFWLVPRLLVDALDQAWWARRLRDPDRVIFVGVPLAAEAGINLGVGGLVVPAVNYLAIRWSRRRIGLDTSPSAVTGQVAAVGIGMALSMLARRHDRGIEARAEAGAEARRTAGFVAGQNAMAGGADSVVDLLARTEPLLAALEGDAGLEVPSGSGTAAALRTWKAGVGAITADHAAYLGTVVRSWERGNRSADLQADVICSFPPATGTTVITHHQAEHLRRRLDAMGLRGEVELELRGSIEEHRPGRAFELRVASAAVGPAVISVPDDPGLVAEAFDPVPLMILGGAISVTATMIPAFGATPLITVLAADGGGLAVMQWIRHRRRAGRPVDGLVLVDVLLVLHAVTAAAIVRTRRDPTGGGGRTLLPMVDCYLVSAMLVAGFLGRRLSVGQHLWIGAKAVAAVAPAARLAGVFNAKELVPMGLLSPAGCYLGTRGMFDYVEAHRDEIVALWDDAATLAAEAGFDRGWRSVIDIVERACDDVQSRLDAVDASPGAVDERVLAEARRRLDSARATLAGLATTDDA